MSVPLSPGVCRTLSPTPSFLPNTTSTPGVALLTQTESHTQVSPPLSIGSRRLVHTSVHLATPSRSWEHQGRKASGFSRHECPPARYRSNSRTLHHPRPAGNCRGSREDASRPSHLLYEVHVGDAFSHGVFHLEACVHLQEVKRQVVRADHLHGPGRPASGCFRVCEALCHRPISTVPQDGPVGHV